MPRLCRPHIPLEVRCRVVLRQLGDLWPDDVIKLWKPKPSDAYLKGIGVFVPRGGLAALLASKLDALAVLLDCKVEDLRLDHDPALATRMRRTMPDGTTAYSPDANSPGHLIYREKHDHHIKTNVRGEHGQHPDRVLIKRERKRNAPPKPCSRCFARYRVPPSRLCLRCQRVAEKYAIKTAKKFAARRRGFNFPINKLKPKRKWPKRRMR
jgi:hypothetical protein